MPITMLVDGSNSWYRSYLATPLDKPGGPMMIFASMLRKLAKNYGKDNIVVCWDAGSAERKALDPGYKADRQAAPGVWEDLPHMKRLISALGIKTAELPGHEADDVIGSLAVSSVNDVLISSYDRDFYQLVSDKIKIFRPARKIRDVQHPDEIIDIAAATEEFSCHPTKIILAKAFLGDPSDNIPKLPVRFTTKFKKDFYSFIDKCNSIEDFYLIVENIPVVNKDEILAFRERAALNYQLLKIKTNLPVVVAESEMNSDRVNAICAEFQIRSVKLDEWLDLHEAPAANNSVSLFD